MLDVLTGQEIVFQPISVTDARLQGEIKLRNNNSKSYLVFKIKSTDVNAFQADPSKGIINPRQTMTIPIITTRSVGVEDARSLSQKNKFLVQYVHVNIKPASIDEAVTYLKSQSSQSIKIYINTDSVRGSGFGNTLRQPSAVGSRYSFRSMAENARTPVGSSTMAESKNNQMQNLKIDIQMLQKQRSRLLRQIQGKGQNKKKGGILKYLIALVLGLVGGNLGSKYTELNKTIKQKIDEHYPHTTTQAHIEAPPPPQPTQPQEEGFFSIFNFGNDEPAPQAVHVEEKKSWWNIL